MLVKDIINKACQLLNDENLASALAGATLDEEGQEKVDCLVKCFNFALDEIACEYHPIIKVEEVKTDNFIIKFSSLSSPILNVISVVDKKGRKVRFKVFSDYIFAYASEVEVIYSTKPTALGIEDEFESNLPERVFAYGVIREYFYIQNLYEDMAAWEERFKNSLQVVTRRKSGVVIPKRWWR